MSRGCRALLAIAVLSARPASAQSQGVVEQLTIEQAVLEAIEHNPDLLAKRADVPVAETAIITASLRPNPVLSLGADHLDWLGTGFNDVNNGGPTELSARVDVPVERGDKRTLRTDEASAGRAIAEAHVADAIRTLTETVTLACVDVIQADENLSLARDTLRTFEELAAMNDARVQAGAAAQYDATRTRVAMLQFRANVTRAELQWRTSALRLRQLLGRPASADPIAVAAPATLSASLASAPAVLEETAVQSRADLRAARMTQARTVADLKLQLAVGKVDFTYGAEYRRQAGPIGLSNSLGVFFSAPLPFANRNQGEIARAGAEGQQADRTTAALEASVRADVRVAFDAYSSSAGLVASIERDLLGPARSARDIAAYSYKAGGTTLVDLIDSQRAYNDAMQSYYDARTEYRRAIAHLNSAVGTEVTK